MEQRIELERFRDLVRDPLRINTKGHVNRVKEMLKHNQKLEEEFGMLWDETGPDGVFEYIDSLTFPEYEIKAAYGFDAAKQMRIMFEMKTETLVPTSYVNVERIRQQTPESAEAAGKVVEGIRAGIRRNSTRLMERL